MRTRTTPSGYVIRLTEEQHRKLVVAFSPSSKKYHMCPLCIEGKKKKDAGVKNDYLGIGICGYCPVCIKTEDNGYPAFFACDDVVADILEVPKVKIQTLNNMRLIPAQRSKQEKKWARTLWAWLKEMDYEEDT